jgi:DNA-binding LytR/AlgR family response regulator
MSANPSIASELPLGIGASEVKASFVAWGIYLAAVCGYCLVHQLLVSNVVPNVALTFVTAVREWGIWLLTTPAAFAVLRKQESTERRNPASILQIATVILLASAAVPVTIDLLMATRDLAASIAIFLPRYIAVLVILYLVWYVFLRKQPTSDAAASAQENRIGDKPQYPEALLVSKGSDECLIQVDRVECVSAAGNYVEIYARKQLYLMRATMKQVEQMLPPSEFIRIHRSHIVKCDEIDRIKTVASGNGSVHLRNGKALSMSKQYKRQLQKYRLH